jgi:apolipoprotein N-acyltransferase
MPAGLGLFPALACLAASWFWDEGPARLLVFGASFGLAEWLRGHVFTGFPWNIAAYGWGASLVVLQTASVVGAYGLTLLTLLLGASLAEFARERKYWTSPALAIGLFALLWVAGSARLYTVQTSFVPNVGLRLVQPNVPQAEKFKRRFVVRNWERLIDLSIEPSKLKITHIVWPEAAPPFFLEREPVALDQIRDLTQGGITLISGAERYSIGENGTPRFFNSLAIFGKGGRLLALYDKFHLVPFGEYLPFASLLNRLGITKLTEGQSGFSSGDGPHTYALPGAPSVGPLICYEILFPGEVVATTRPGWFINVTDDSWFGPYAGPYQHLLTAQVRAIEEGIPVVRDANTGISAVIDPHGRTIATLPLDHLGVLDARLPAALASTPYGRFGDLGYWLMIAACGLGSLVLRRK